MAKTKESWMTRLYRKYKLDNPSDEETEAVATRLLSNPRTYFDGAELTLGRRVDAKETEILQIVVAKASAEEKYAMLLLQKSREMTER